MIEAAVPGRARTFEATQVPTPLWQRAILGRDLAPTASEWERVCAATWEGDAPMDALIDWMFDVGPQRGKTLFERALHEGIDSVVDAPEPLRTFFQHVERTPDWVDFELVEEGVRFCHRVGSSALFVLRDVALMGGYLLPAFNHTLVLTGALSKGASQRVAETSKWWFDCTEPGGLRRSGIGWRTTLHVRLVHGLVRRSISKRSEWDAGQWGLPINQIDMAATYLAFCVVLLGGVRLLGVPVLPRESRAVMHLWSYACWLMGVDESWLRFRETDGLVLLHHATLTHGAPDWTSRELGAALATEPLERTFDDLQDMRRRFAWHCHLSVSRYFLGRKKMTELGLPDGITPWFPIATLVPRFASYTGQRFVPVLAERQERRGRAAQKQVLAGMFGKKAQRVIAPDVHHPAHV